MQEQTKNYKPAIKELAKDGIKDFRPSEFMRARRPNLFSDSKTVTEPSLTREVFEYHLDTLTSRKQETEFEHFCRRLAEKEICPNIIPQTGPTGGGDSKADAETYPVADEIALRWYEGIGREASYERWAFAFSAMKEWRSKCYGDVEKIVNTQRSYKEIYFITNQFVKDKTRAEVEEKLSKKYSVGVHILDRNWIVKCVFENNRLQLAIDTLKFTGYEAVSHKIVGPHDTEREMELKEFDQQIEDADRYRGVEYQLAEDCLQSAFIARGLERPRTEVDGRFQRAERVADKVGNSQQLMRIFYAKAWTVFWWYNDFNELNRLYDHVEKLVICSSQSTDLELLANLWTVLYTSVARGQLKEKDANINERTEKLKSALERLAAEKHRPNNALWAKTRRLLMDINEAAINKISLDDAFSNLKKVLIKSEGLVEFPITSITQIIQELGDFYADSPAYDELFDVVVNLMKRRASEGEAGCLLLQRGQQKLMGGKKYDAIRLLGQAQQMLAKSEYQEEWIRSLAICGLAYEASGLLWAARANTLVAANQSLSEFLKHGKIKPLALRCVQKLVWLELQLGRVFHALAWVELASGIASHLMLEGDRRKEFLEERKLQDITLGLLLLKTDVCELKWIEFLPQILDGLGFDHSWMALLYALGHEKHLRLEGVIPKDESPEAVLDFFEKWLEQPVNKDLPDYPELMQRNKVTLRSFVLGCEVTVEAVNNFLSLNLGETILSALEALLATCLDPRIRIFPHVSELKINIQPSDLIKGIPEYKVSDDAGCPLINIRHPLLLKRVSGQGKDVFQAWLMKFILETTFRVAMVDNHISFETHIIDAEHGLERALNFSDPSIPIENILGKAPKFRSSDWEIIAGTARFAFQRDLPWNHGIKKAIDNEETEDITFMPGKGEPPDELFGIDKLKHKDRRVISLINIPLWNKAEWCATLYIYYPDALPVLALGFRNAEAGKQIFKELRSKLGQIDDKEKLRVSIITGIDKKHPSSYKVIISTNLPRSKQHSSFIVVSRINRMDPSDLRNLNTFIDLYKRVGKYAILPADIGAPANDPKPFFDFSIIKRELYIRPAWEIGENDPDVVGIHDEDDPIIPDGIADAPVIRALQRFKKEEKRTHHFK